nr:hypothetical protein [Tanacetum cinerariifolium]
MGLKEGARWVCEQVHMGRWWYYLGGVECTGEVCGGDGVFGGKSGCWEITCSCFHGFIDKDLINLVIPEVRRYVVVLTGIYYHLKELGYCAQCLIEDEDFIKRSRSALREEV